MCLSHTVASSKCIIAQDLKLEIQFSVWSNNKYDTTYFGQAHLLCWLFFVAPVEANMGPYMPNVENRSTACLWVKFKLGFCIFFLLQLNINKLLCFYNVILYFFLWFKRLMCLISFCIKSIIRNMTELCWIQPDVLSHIRTPQCFGAPRLSRRLVSRWFYSIATM